MLLRVCSERRYAEFQSVLHIGVNIFRLLLLARSPIPVWDIRLFRGEKA